MQDVQHELREGREGRGESGVIQVSPVSVYSDSTDLRRGGSYRATVNMAAAGGGRSIYLL